MGPSITQPFAGKLSWVTFIAETLVFKKTKRFGLLQHTRSYAENLTCIIILNIHSNCMTRGPSLYPYVVDINLHPFLHPAPHPAAMRTFYTNPLGDATQKCKGKKGYSQFPATRFKLKISWEKNKKWFYEDVIYFEFSCKRIVMKIRNPPSLPFPLFRVTAFSPLSLFLCLFSYPKWTYMTIYWFLNILNVFYWLPIMVEKHGALHLTTSTFPSTNILK